MASDTADPARTRSMSFHELVWHPVDPTNPDRPPISALWSKTREPFGALLRVHAGLESPLPSQTHDVRMIQLCGRSVHWTQGESRKTAPVMTSGDHMMMPRGVEHVNATAEGEESIEFITMDGAFDFTLLGSIPEGK